MTISVSTLSLLVITAIVITSIAPIALVLLWIKDWLREKLW